jgi:hypothetical protein
MHAACKRHFSSIVRSNTLVPTLAHFPVLPQASASASATATATSNGGDAKAAAEAKAASEAGKPSNAVAVANADAETTAIINDVEAEAKAAAEVRELSDTQGCATIDHRAQLSTGRHSCSQLQGCASMCDKAATDPACAVVAATSTCTLLTPLQAKAKADAAASAAAKAAAEAEATAKAAAEAQAKVRGDLAGCALKVCVCHSGSCIPPDLTLRTARQCTNSAHKRCVHLPSLPAGCC